jgi:hypothetical protein
MPCKKQVNKQALDESTAVPTRVAAQSVCVCLMTCTRAERAHVKSVRFDLRTESSTARSVARYYVKF